MRTTFLFIISLYILTPFSAAYANTLIAKIDGMVCAFCAVGLEEQIKKDPATSTVKISMDDSTVTVISKPEKTVLPKTIEKAVYYMGFTLKDLKETK